MSQQKAPNEDIILVFLILMTLGGLCWVVWHFYSLELTNFARWIRIVEMRIALFVHGDKVSLNYPGLGPQKLVDWLSWFRRAKPENLSLLDFEVASALSMVSLKYFFQVGIAVMAVVAFMRGPGTQYKRKLNLETLMKEQSKSFSIISPFLKFDPRKLPNRAPGQPVPAVLPMFSEALAPEEWIAFHEIKTSGANIDVNKTYQALVLQLGKRWQGPLKLPLHAQGLFAAFALRHVRKRKDSELMLDNLAKSWSADRGFKPSFKLVREIRSAIKNPKIGGALTKFADEHAYETTALLRALSRARQEGGVLAPATFLWLRAHDRALWYPLNNLGRKSYHAEAAGAMVHYTNELIAGQKIPTPRVEEVIRGLETYLKSSSARAIPELDRKASSGKFWKKK